MSRKLTDKQRQFVNQVAKGVNPTKAARASNYSAPAVAAHNLMRLPHVREELHQRRDAALKGDLASLAIDTMRDLMAPSTPAATRYQAAKWTLEHAGHTSGADDQGRGERSLEEMDADELAKAVTSGMQALQELAGQLEGTHYVDGQSRQVRTIEHQADEEEETSFLD